MKNCKAFLFDLNGTMIDDMEYHAQAWYDILNTDLKAGLSYSEVKSHMYGKNDELLIRIFGKDYFSEKKIKTLSIEKERRYQHNYFPRLRLIDGLEHFLQEAKQEGILLAIGSAAILFNIDFIVDNLNLRHYFDTIVSADDVLVSKPDPETYIKCARQLGVRNEDCIVFEDAPKGVEAAERAGMKAIVITTMHATEEFKTYCNIIQFIKDYKTLHPRKFL